ncbi:hypothetical protein RJ640_003606 [Escallonia rubra]|uniref:E3 ubiquitin protein ligase n=1 Tax=Escallonia rubra TaxID=112253 RepID=A0AA88RIH4_9ASTE|nr:hypothetical protein RJ640_003606 [Escallonia rubra]
MKEKKPHKTFLKWAETYGPIYSIKAGYNSMVILNSNEVAKETIGQAYEDMQTQNQHLLQQVAERDDYNIKLVSESVKTKQGQSFLLSEKQALAKQLQQVNTSLGSLRLRIAHNEEQLKVYITEALKSTQEDRRLVVNLETVKWELADAEKELKWLKSAVSSSEKEYEQIQRKMDEIQNELDNERCFPVTIFSTL